jgi:hypothetical protein
MKTLCYAMIACVFGAAAIALIEKPTAVNLLVCDDAAKLRGGDCCCLDPQYSTTTCNGRTFGDSMGNIWMCDGDDFDQYCPLATEYTSQFCQNSETSCSGDMYIWDVYNEYWAPAGSCSIPTHYTAQAAAGGCAVCGYP